MQIRMMLMFLQEFNAELLKNFWTHTLIFVISSYEQQWYGVFFPFSYLYTDYVKSLTIEPADSNLVASL